MGAGLARGRRSLCGAGLLASLVAGFAPQALAATITIVNVDGVGEGFNDATPAAPVGGNPGTTIGAQRLYVFQYAAGIWANLLPSGVEIRVRAQFNPQDCTATSGVLGSAGPWTYFRDFPGALLPGHWYHVALASKLSGTDQDPSFDDITTTFNSSIGQATCLPAGWYYGVDGNEGSQYELLPVVLHELGHGLGFSTPTSGSSGNYFLSFPSVYDHYLYDNGIGLHWDQMSAAQRVSSATACTRLAWDGSFVVQNAPQLLARKPVLRVNAPAAIAGDYDAGTATFGAPLTTTGVTQGLVLVDDGVGTVTNGCEPLINGGAVSGKIALIDRGACPFIVKVKNAQAAGAIAAVVADSLPGCPPAGMSGLDPTITIPSLRITQADGNLLKANLAAGVNVTLTRDPLLLAGADAAGRVRVYTPSTFSGGSSISHWDVTADPNLLMEPSLNSNLSDEVDLTRWHFADIGWFDDLVAVNRPGAGAPRPLGNSPNPFDLGTTIRFTLEREQHVELSVYDLSGRQVAELLRGTMAEGAHAVPWDGRDREGRSASAGIYLYRLRTGREVESRHMVRVR